MLFVGGYDYPPNAEAARILAGEVLPLVRRRRPDAELHLVGRDPEGRLGELPPREGVFIHGHVEDLRPHYERASAVVAPITFGGGSRIKMLEAFAYGRPVVCTRACAAGLGLVPGKHYLRGEIPATLADAFLRLAEDRKTQRNLIEACRKRVEEHHDPEVLARRFRGIIASAVENGA